MENKHSVIYRQKSKKNEEKEESLTLMLLSNRHKELIRVLSKIPKQLAYILRGIELLQIASYPFVSEVRLKQCFLFFRQNTLSKQT